MKIKIYIPILMVITLNMFLYTQDDNSAKENVESNDFEQRRQALYMYIKQEIAKGKNLLEIRDQPGGLKEQYKNAMETKAYENAKKAKDKYQENVWKNNCIKGFIGFIDTPFCQSMKKDYIKLEQESDRLEKIYNNTPEKQIYLDVVDFFYNGNSPQRKFRGLLEEKQTLDQELKDLLEEKQKIENIISKLVQERRDLLFELSLY